MFTKFLPQILVANGLTKSKRSGLSPVVPADAGFLYDTTAALGDTIKGTFCTTATLHKYLCTFMAAPIYDWSLQYMQCVLCEVRVETDKTMYEMQRALE